MVLEIFSGPNDSVVVSMILQHPWAPWAREVLRVELWAVNLHPGTREASVGRGTTGTLRHKPCFCSVWETRALHQGKARTRRCRGPRDRWDCSPAFPWERPGTVLQLGTVTPGEEGAEGFHPKPSVHHEGAKGPPWDLSSPPASSPLAGHC